MSHRDAVSIGKCGDPKVQQQDVNILENDEIEFRPISWKRQLLKSLPNPRRVSLEHASACAETSETSTIALKVTTLAQEFYEQIQAGQYLTNTSHHV